MGLFHAIQDNNSYFQLIGNGPQPYPDVIPREEGNRYEHGYRGPCQDPPTDESNYTPLFIPSSQGSKENTDYASLQRPDYAELTGPDYAELTGPDYAELQGPDYAELETSNYADQGGPDYAELEPEGEQYTSLLSTAKDSKDGSSLSSSKQEAAYQTTNKDEPVYHVLESTSDSPIADRRDRGNHQSGSQVKQTANESSPVYQVVEREDSCTKRGENSDGTIGGDATNKNESLDSVGATSANLYEAIHHQASPQENMYQALDESVAKSSKRNTYTACPRPKLKTSRSMTTLPEISAEYTEPCIRPTSKGKPGNVILRAGQAAEQKPDSEYLKPVTSSAASTQLGRNAERNDRSMAQDSSSEYLQPNISPSSSTHFGQVAANEEHSLIRTSESLTYASPDYVVPNSVLPEGRFTIPRNHQSVTRDCSFGVNDSRVHTQLTDNRNNAESQYQALKTAQQPEPQTYESIVSNEAGYISVIVDEDGKRNSDMENPSYQTIVRTGYMNQR